MKNDDCANDRKNSTNKFGDIQILRIRNYVGIHEEYLPSAVSRNRFCDVAFAELLRNASFIVEKADYSGCKGTYYVEAQNGQRIWFDNVVIKNEDILVKYRRLRIEVLQALIDAKFQKTI